jgi:hypothetical protein
MFASLTPPPFDGRRGWFSLIRSGNTTMHLVDLDILTAGQGLSVPACAVGLGIGGVLWLLGGLSYRFWIVVLITLASGVYGLSVGPAFGVQPLVSGLLLAIAGGVLALALARVGAFLAGGITVCVLAESIVPGWNEPFIFFFVGGFLGLLMLRFWFMVMSSLAGSVVTAYSLLWLFDALGKLDAIAFATNKPVLLNWACAGAALVGLLIQVGIARRFWTGKGDGEDEDEDEAPLLLRWLPFVGGGKKKRRAA